MTARAWAQADTVLCVRLDTLGDVLMTSPAIRALKSGRRGRRVTLLTSAAGVEIGRLIPEIGDVIAYDAPWMKATPARTDSGPDYAMAERLRAARFDAAVIFTVFSQNPLPAALLCYLAGVPLRLAHCRENPYQLLTDWVREPEPDTGVRHEVRRQLDLVAAVGCQTTDERLSLRVPAQTGHRIRRLLAEGGADLSRPWAVVHPGATAPSRRYPPEHFAEAARRLASDHGFDVVFTGGRSEVQLVNWIARTMQAPSISLAGRLTLEELAALLSLAPVLIANNTGPVHVAAALGTPVVDLYALTNPQHTPWGVPHRVLSRDVPCKYCYKSVCPAGHHACLRLINPEEVVAAALELTSFLIPAREPFSTMVGVDDGVSLASGDEPPIQRKGDDTGDHERH
jgi:lipopolysaccharide heptosyltransferase II